MRRLTGGDGGITILVLAGALTLRRKVRVVENVVARDGIGPPTGVDSTQVTVSATAPPACPPIARKPGDPTLADGILDRLVHNAHRIEMKGDSMRKNRGKANHRVD